MKKIILIILILIGFFAFYNFFIKEDYINSKYSESVLTIANKNGIKLDNYEYSKTLEEMLLNNLFNSKYLTEYIKIDYLNKDNFLININTFLKIGYKAEEINDIYVLSDKNISKLLKKDYLKLDNYLNITNFNVDNYERYEDYLKEEKDIKKAIIYVNVGLDKPFYENAKKTTRLQQLDILVNKYNYIDKDYVPNNLKNIPGYANIKMIDEAADNFYLFQKKAHDDGHPIIPTTAYRTYAWQKSLYNTYSNKDGKDKADTYSARPGYSEHQTGLAVDLNNPNYEGARLSQANYDWVLKNSYKYGFIVRYPKNKTNITGYQEEPWHLRYLGIELATKVVKSNLTYDEYYDLYIEEY